MEIVPHHAISSSELSTALRAIAKDDPGLALRVAIAEDGRDEFRQAFEDWLETKSWHGVAKVASAMSHLGLPADWDAIDAATGTDTRPNLQQLTKTRHTIVHKGARPKIKRDDVKAAIELVASLALHIDQRVCSGFPKRR